MLLNFPIKDDKLLHDLLNLITPLPADFDSYNISLRAERCNLPTLPPVNVVLDPIDIL